MDVTEFLAEFRSTLSAPESYLNPSPELSSKCLIGLKTVFDFYKKCSENGSVKIPTGPLSELFTEGFDNEQIWEEIQLVNEPVIDYMGKLLSEMENWDYSELFNDSVNAPQQSHSDGGNGSESEDLQHVDGSDEGAGELNLFMLILRIDLYFLQRCTVVMKRTLMAMKKEEVRSASTLEERRWWMTGFSSSLKWNSSWKRLKEKKSKV